MTTLWIVLCRFLNNNFVQLATGAFVLTSGITEFYEDFIHEGIVFSPTHGISLLGLITIIISLEHIIVGNEILIKEITEKKTFKVSFVNKKLGLLENLFESTYYQLAFGILLVFTGIGSAYEDLVNPQAMMATGEGLWYVGIMLIGLRFFSHGLTGFAFGLKRIDVVKNKFNWHYRLLSCLNLWVRNPRTELILALVVIGLGVIEQFVFEVIKGDSLWNLEGHHGMIIYGVSMLSKLASNVYFGLELAEDSHEQAIV